MATLKQMQKARDNLRAWREHDQANGLILVWVVNPDGAIATLNSHSFAEQAQEQFDHWKAEGYEVQAARLPYATVVAMVAKCREDGTQPQK